MLSTMGFDDAPGGHGEVSFTDVRLPASAIVGGPGQAFAIAQARLGPGRVHHCMRLIGLAELALELACRRATERVAFGKPLANLGGNRERIADARIAIDQARLHVLHAAWLIDTQSGAGGQSLGAVSQIKVAVPNMAQRVVDMAMQLHGGAGLTDDFPLGAAWTVARALRLADGPDEVHRGVIARLELARYGAGKWGSHKRRAPSAAAPRTSCHRGVAPRQHAGPPALARPSRHRYGSCSGLTILAVLFSILAPDTPLGRAVAVTAAGHDAARSDRHLTRGRRARDSRGLARVDRRAP